MTAANAQCNTVAVFESCIDAISHATLKKLQGEDYKDIHRIALGGTADNALIRFLENHPAINRVILCLDNDEAGRNAIKQLHKTLSTYNKFEILVQTPYAKDFNADLKKLSAHREHKQTQTDEKEQTDESDMEMEP